jgi:hypothetical protein
VATVEPARKQPLPQAWENHVCSAFNKNVSIGGEQSCGSLILEQEN